MHLFVPYLKQRLQQALPGRNVQLKMAPEPVGTRGPERKMEPTPHARQSSVLVLFYPNKEMELEILLTLRSSDIDHGGQISFPGGRSEEGETPVETALREAREEVGIDPGQVHIAGQLTKLFVSHSNNDVTPVVGYMEEQPELSLDPREVEEAFSVELESLLGKKNLTVEDWNLRNHTFKVPYWDVHRVPLWGATAMMLNEFLELYREFRSEAHNAGID
ncbi:NUDIX hydrolase [Halalkalibaculum sp. DA3122]|uniref:NUDIX hydrolase n=1 Tax=Halalkalibaculum sp. DA3122 TaxID=3373607 RepID=UPI003754209D